MSTTLDREKSELLAKAIDLALARKGSGGPPHDSVGSLLKSYYRHVAPEDVCDRTEVDLYGALAHHYKLATSRPQGTAQVRVFTPTVSEHGWSANAHSVVEVVTDDMPFLVDSITMQLANQQRNLHVIVHHGRNSHHVSEAIFKAAARALRMAVEIDPRTTGVPSTKGTLTS